MTSPESTPLGATFRCLIAGVVIASAIPAEMALAQASERSGKAVVELAQGYV